MLLWLNPSASWMSVNHRQHHWNMDPSAWSSCALADMPWKHLESSTWNGWHSLIMQPNEDMLVRISKKYKHIYINIHIYIYTHLYYIQYIWYIIHCTLCMIHNDAFWILHYWVYMILYRLYLRYILHLHICTRIPDWNVRLFDDTKVHVHLLQSNMPPF